MTRVYLIRHGKPSATWGGVDEDPGLDETGKAQAEDVAKTLLALPEAERPTHVVSVATCGAAARPPSPAPRRSGLEIEIDAAVGETPDPEEPGALRARRLAAATPSPAPGPR